jgi:hypothetical protein
VTAVFGEHFEGVEAHTEPRIATPEQPDRIRTLACIDVTDSFGDSGICDEEAENGLS